MSDRWGVDLADDNSFQRFFGGSDNRGFHVLLEAGLRGSPEHIRDLVNLVSADNLIYVRGNTCESDIGLTRTLAHEHNIFCSVQIIESFGLSRVYFRNSSRIRI